MDVVLPEYQTLLATACVCVCIMTAGTIFLMWIGEQIDEYGIGNGISLLIMAGILARMPLAHRTSCWQNATPKLTPEAGKYGIIDDRAPGRPVRRGGRRRDRDHREPAADPDPVGQARPRPAGLRRDAAVPAAEGQPGGRHADHLRLQPADLPLVHPQRPGAGHRRPGGPTTGGPSWSVDSRLVVHPRGGRRLPEAELRLHGLLHHPDLLLLLLLDGDHLQPEGHGREPQGLRQLHPRLPARAADGRLPREGHAPDHLRRRGVPEPRGRHPVARPERA